MQQIATSFFVVVCFQSSKLTQLKKSELLNTSELLSLFQMECTPKSIQPRKSDSSSSGLCCLYRCVYMWYEHVHADHDVVCANAYACIRGVFVCMHILYVCVCVCTHVGMMWYMWLYTCDKHVYHVCMYKMWVTCIGYVFHTFCVPCI